MNTTAIKQVIDSISPLNAECWEDLTAFFTIRNVKKGEIILDQNEICKHVYFVNSGLMRCYYFSPEGREITGEFFDENCFLTDYFSFSTQKPSTTLFQALEECELISIPRPAVYLMYDKYHAGERFGRLIAERSFIELMNSILIEKTLSPEQRYIKLQSERPELLERVSLNMIASFLRITPEHLSRIRKKMATTIVAKKQKIKLKVA
jgi:CRP-like cAMP-binding protein